MQRWVGAQLTGEAFEVDARHNRHNEIPAKTHGSRVSLRVVRSLSPEGLAKKRTVGKSCGRFVASASTGSGAWQLMRRRVQPQGGRIRGSLYAGRPTWFRAAMVKHTVSCNRLGLHPQLCSVPTILWVEFPDVAQIGVIQASGLGLGLPGMIWINDSI